MTAACCCPPLRATNVPQIAGGVRPRQPRVAQLPRREALLREIRVPSFVCCDLGRGIHSSPRGRTHAGPLDYTYSSVMEIVCAR